MGKNRVQFMNTYVDNITLNEAVEHIEDCIKSRTIGHVITPNVDQIVRMEWDDYFKQIHKDSELSLVDGHPLLWIAKLYKKPFKQKITGSDLVPYLCSIAAEKGYSVFFLGAAEGVAKIAASKMEEVNPGLKVVGTYSPPFNFLDDKEELGKINDMLFKSKADMLFVGLGVPKQDIFIYQNMKNYMIPMSFSVGATIDFIAGVQKRAPKWMSNNGLEWLYRLIREPKRMFKRYIVDDLKIFYLMFKYWR